MLIEFSVENYRSFRDRVTFSMVAARDDSLPGNVWLPPEGNSLGLVKAAALYGPNSSGKSNFIKALSFMDRFVRTSSSEGQRDSAIDVVPFKFDLRCADEATKLEIVFVSEKVRYVYGFTADRLHVRSEWLHSYPLGQRRLLFERTREASLGEATYRFGASWKGGKTAIQNLVRPNSLFVSVAAQLNSPSAQIVLDWFREQLCYVSWWPARSGEFEFTCDAALKDAASKQGILGFLRQADLQVQDFTVDRRPIGETEEWRRMPERLQKAFAEKFTGDVLAVETIHTGVNVAGDAIRVSLELIDESDGTQKLYALAGPWLEVLKSGRVLVVDELDARLHPLLTRWLITQFHNPVTNPLGAQLIFATHDASLLDTKLFRRDQLWFTEKDRAGATSLYSLWDFKKTPRKEENVRKGYLAGRYGAIPLVAGVGQ